MATFKRLLTTLCAVSLLAFSYSVLSAETESSIARGGRLYDKWYAVVDADKPDTSHPAYPADKKYAKKPGSNWRCKECHGWDTMGKDGAYASGKHSTGIKGVNNADAASIISVIKDDTHQYADKLSDADMQDLANFISMAAVNYSDYIDSATKSVKGGDAAQGEAYFNTICSSCHGVKGDQPKDMKKTLAKQMGNPWEVMHKILNGQPAEDMPALRALDRQVVVDIMAHIATLPMDK